MATAKNGINGYVTGKVGATIYYVRYGKQVLRAASHIIKPRSEKQMAQQQKMSLLKPIISYLKLYIRVGFALTAIQKADSANNCAKSYNLKNAIKGEYPNQELDYPAIKLTEGVLAEPLNPLVESLPQGLKFTWDYDDQDPNGIPYDRSMLIAVFPEQPLRFFQIISGAERSECEELLKIPLEMKGKYAETYISFITDDRSGISNSLYTGRVLY